MTWSYHPQTYTSNHDFFTIHTEMTKHFPAKILLFGEYAVIRGSDALITPYDKFYGYIQSSWVTHPSIRNLYQFCKEQWFDRLDMNQRSQDIEHNKLNYISSIPISYGIGSSGALVAAIYHKYHISHTRMIDTIHQHLSNMESWFHGHSSGMDPLTSLLQHTLYKTQHTIRPVEDIRLPSRTLIDTQQKGSTKKNVQRFQTAVSDTWFAKSFDEYFVTNTNHAIQTLLNHKTEEFWEALRNLSARTIENLQDLIPSDYQDYRKQWLKTNQYYCKLCGSGGGGFILQYNRHANI